MAVIHFRGIGNFARVHDILRIKQFFDIGKQPGHAGAKHDFIKFRPGNAIPMFAGMRPAIALDQRKRFFSNTAHRCYIFAALHIQHWPDMQTANRGMRIPCAHGAIFLKNTGELIGIFGQIA